MDVIQVVMILVRAVQNPCQRHFSISLPVAQLADSRDHCTY